MIKSGFKLLLVLLVICGSWLNFPSPATAQPALVQSTAQLTAPFPFSIAMANKPLFSFSGKRPDNLGVNAGKLAACPGTPNCVCSQAATTDKEHFVEPIAYQSAPAEAMDKLKSVIQSMERTKIINESSDYLYAEFTSALMGFVDDVEFYLEPNGIIQVRSASRLGQSDLGVNRKRIEEIRSKFQA